MSNLRQCTVPPEEMRLLVSRIRKALAKTRSAAFKNAKTAKTVVLIGHHNGIKGGIARATKAVEDVLEGAEL